MTLDFGTLVSKKLWDERERKSIARAIAETNRELVGSGSDTINLLIRKSTGAEYISATASVTASSHDYDTVSVTVDKRLHYDFYVPYIHQKLGNVNFIQQSLDVGLQEMARQLDLEVLKTAAGYTAVTDEAVGTGDGSETEFSLDHSPILQVTSVELDGTPTTDYTVDYDDGKIKFGSAPSSGVAITASYAYADSDTNYTHVSTVGDFGITDVLNAIATMQARGFTPDFLVIPPRAYYLLGADLVSKFQFTQGTKEVPGMVGAIGNVEVIVTDVLPESYAVLLKGPPTGAIVKVHASDVTVKKWDRPDYARVDVYLDEFVKPVRVLDDAVEVIIGFASNAY